MTDSTLPETFDLRSLDVAAEQKEKLRQLFPEVFTEGGKVDFDRLKSTLGEIVDTGKERYGMNWPGKAECFRTIQAPSRATLRPSRDQSVNFDSTGNLIIEGDNLEALKLLQKGYLGQVKMIYIDPPYNTGNDFIYPDNFAESLDTYLSYSGQVDSDGKKFSTNPETDGRFHSKWINMMYPRLFLARNLLRDNGVIFVSIGDHEIHNLRALLNDIFGEENYINTICIKAKPSAGASGGGEDKRLKKNVEFLLAYAKNREEEGVLDLNQAFDETELAEHISGMREEGKSWKYTRAVTEFGNREQISSIVDGDGNEITVFRHKNYKFASISELTRSGESEADAYMRHFDTVFRDTNAQSSIRTRVMDAVGEEDGFFSIDYKPRSGRSKGKMLTVYYKGPKKDQLAWLRDIAVKEEKSIQIRGKTGTLWMDFNWNNVSKEGEIAFPNGKKPIAFIQRMLQVATKPHEDHIILDFFGGSGSTGHAVWAQNEQDGGNRKFILVQLPEPSDIEGYSTISSLCLERLRRSGKQLKDQTGQLQLTTVGRADSDLGFRVFKLDASNFKPWDGTQPEGVEGVAKQLELHVDHVLPGRSQEDILIELLLKSGFSLSTKVEETQLAGKQVFSVEDGTMLVCLDGKLTSEVIKAMADKKPSRVICLDDGFQGNDQLKTNAVQTMKARGVLSFRTV